MKIANIDRESLHNFWTTWGISMKFSGNLCLMIILEVTKNQGFIISLEDTFFEKPQGGRGVSNCPPPLSPLAILGLSSVSCEIVSLRPSPPLEIILYGDKMLYDKSNPWILTATINYIKNTQRFEQSLF